MSSAVLNDAVLDDVDLDLEWIEAELARREQQDERAELARRFLKEFVIQAWHVIEPVEPLVWSWHLDVICEHVQALLEHRLGDYQNLLINVPPGSMKSTIVAVCTTPWMWLRNPSWRGIYVSGSEKVTLRDSMKCKDILTSEWYQQTFKPKWKFSENQNAKGHYINTEKGFRSATTAGAKITGERADAIFVDDPNDAQLAFSKAHLDQINRYWDHALANRLTSMERGVRCLIQQRLSEEDLTGHVTTTEPDNWACLIIREEFEEPSEKDLDFKPTPLGWKDRREVGELMFEARFPRWVIEAERLRLASFGFAGQYQQRPSPATGGILLRHWWRYWQHPGQNLPPVTVRTPEGYERTIMPVTLPMLSEQVMSVDCAFKGEVDSDFVVAGVWGKSGANRYLLHQMRDRMDCAKTIKAIETLSSSYPLARAKIIEDAANGPAVVSMLRDRVAGLILVKPEGNKVGRVQAALPQIEAGNVFLPHPQIAPWVDGFINECASFPNGSNDDQVDQMSQALNRMGKQAGGFRSEFIA